MGCIPKYPQVSSLDPKWILLTGNFIGWSYGDMLGKLKCFRSRCSPLPFCCSPTAKQLGTWTVRHVNLCHGYYSLSNLKPAYLTWHVQPYREDRIESDRTWDEAVEVAACPFQNFSVKSCPEARLPTCRVFLCGLQVQLRKKKTSVHHFVCPLHVCGHVQILLQSHTWKKNSRMR